MLRGVFVLVSVVVSFLLCRWYRAPELLYGARQYDNGVDMWYDIHTFSLTRACTATHTFLKEKFYQIYYIHRVHKNHIKLMNYSNSIIRAVGCIFGEMLNNSPLFPVNNIYDTTGHVTLLQGENDIDQLCYVLRILGTPNETIWPVRNCQ